MAEDILDFIPEERQLPGLEFLPIMATAALSLTLGFIAKDFLDPTSLLSVLPGAEKRNDILDEDGIFQYNQQMNRRREDEVIRGFDFSAVPPVSTFEYHPANYQVMQQKLNLIKMQQLLDLEPKSRPISHLHNIFNNNIEKSYERPPIILRNEKEENYLQNDDYSANFDFKPFFPDYSYRPKTPSQKNVVVNPSTNKQSQQLEERYDSENSALLKLLNLPSNVKDFDKYLDTKTVVAGVDIVSKNN